MSLHIRWNLAMFLLNVTEYIVTEIAGLHGLATLHIGKSKNLKKKKQKLAFANILEKSVL